MTEGISALGGMSSLSLVDVISNKTSNKEDDEKNGDIFDLMFQTIDESLNQVQDNLGKTNSASESSSADLNFGPPANITIENFDYSAEQNSSENVSMADSTGQSTGGAGGGEGSDDDEDDSNNPMDLNQDGTVTIDEMISYFEAQESYGSSGNGENSNSQNANQFEQIFDMLV